MYRYSSAKSGCCSTKLLNLSVEKPQEGARDKGNMKQRFEKNAQRQTALKTEVAWLLNQLVPMRGFKKKKGRKDNYYFYDQEKFKTMI